MEMREPIQFLIILVFIVPFMFMLLTAIPKNDVGGSDIVTNSSAYTNVTNYSSRWQSWSQEVINNSENRINETVSVVGTDNAAALFATAFGSVMSTTVRIAVSMISMVGMMTEGVTVYMNLLFAAIPLLPAPVRDMLANYVAPTLIMVGSLLAGIAVIMMLIEFITGRKT